MTFIIKCRSVSGSAILWYYYDDESDIIIAYSITIGYWRRGSNAVMYEMKAWLIVVPFVRPKGQ